MIGLEWQILLAVGLDLLLGDPRWLPHPVNGIAALAKRCESLTRRLVRNARAAGVASALLVYASAGLAAWAAIRLAGCVHPLAGDLVGVYAVYAAVAARGMVRHSLDVYRPLSAGDIGAARRAVAMIVGRDVDRLDGPGVARAAVESVAESSVDGVTAPLFWAMVAGPVGAVVYRAANTLDSLFGHRDERYERFGWASARLDDAANYVPARVTAALMAPAAFLLQLRAASAWRVLRRDGRKHASPNAGLPEAAMAGALGVQLGGTNCYGGRAIDCPVVGDGPPPSADDIPRANGLMLATAALFLLIGLAVRVMILQLAI